MELNESGTIEAKEMIEIVGNLCELEGVAKVEISNGDQNIVPNVCKYP